MNWSGFYRRIQPWTEPRWLEAWWVQRCRRQTHLQPGPHLNSDHQRRLFVDVSVIRLHDAGTGIQRVVRSIATSLVNQAHVGWEVVPVGATREQSFRAVTWGSGGRAGECMEARAGDVFLGLDFSLDDVRRHWRQLASFKRQGGQLWFFMYDLLPIERPDWFSDWLVVRFRRWLRATASLADGYFCISEPVKKALTSALMRRYGVKNSLRFTVVPMGWEFGPPQLEEGLNREVQEALAVAQVHPTVLMVGTLEPRKGHADVLAAFECLWAQGRHIRLLLVGRQGWKNQPLVNRIQSHPLLGTHLFWLSNVGDAALEHLYAASAGVIVASYAEGFGLPVIEALGRAKPVLARRIDVFQIHEQAGITFFDANVNAISLAKTLETWLLDLKLVALKPRNSETSWDDAGKCILAELSMS